MENEQYLTEHARKFLDSLKNNGCNNPCRIENEQLDQYTLCNTLFNMYTPTIKWGYLEVDVSQDVFTFRSKEKKITLSGHFFIYHDGTAIFSASAWASGKEEGRACMKTFFFRVGCKHNYKRVEIGRCLHRETCEKCGYQHDIDTSD